ncbi:MAG TPA: POTRA domain-containing protein, partial [Vicinamibacteria bacterium]|nr:POTRA domain-containing protein [Vicinamibacteria bacterium]
MRVTVVVLLAAALQVALGSASANAQESPTPEGRAPVVAQIEVVGNQFLQRETLLYYVQARPGDAYDEKKLRDDFKRLWDTGFLDDLVVESFDTPEGKLVRFRVTERKRIQIVDFRGSKDLTTSNIEDELKKRDSQIKIDTFYDPVKARKVETIIKEMLAE